MRDRRYRRVLGAAVLSGLSLILVGCGMPVIDNEDAKRAKRSPPIPYQTLRPEKSAFELSLKTEPGYPKPETIAARNKFPTTRDCLIQSEKTALEPDLRLIDWKTIRTRPELNVCLTLIFKSLESVEAISLWLAFHYFKSNGQDPIKSEAPRPVKLPDGETIFLGYYYWEDNLPFRDKSRLPHIIAPKFYVRIAFQHSDGKPISVFSKWQQSM